MAMLSLTNTIKNESIYETVSFHLLYGQSERKDNIQLLPKEVHKIYQIPGRIEPVTLVITSQEEKWKLKVEKNYLLYEMSSKGEWGLREAGNNE